MGFTRKHSKGSAKFPSPIRFPRFRLCASFIVWIAALASVCAGFNLDVDNRVVYTGPEGSYFGYSVEFYVDQSSRSDLFLLIRPTVMYCNHNHVVIMSSRTTVNLN